MKVDLAAGILAQIGVATVAAIFCFIEEWPIPGFIAGMFAFGLTTVWINATYVCLLRQGKEPPRWLARLERLRQYLANEGDGGNNHDSKRV